MLKYKGSVDLDITYHFIVEKSISESTTYEVTSLTDDLSLLGDSDADKNIDECVYMVIKNTIQKMCERGQINLL